MILNATLTLNNNAWYQYLPTDNYMIDKLIIAADVDMDNLKLVLFEDSRELVEETMLLNQTFRYLYEKIYRLHPSLTG